LAKAAPIFEDMNISNEYAIADYIIGSRALAVLSKPEGFRRRGFAVELIINQEFQASI